MKFLAIFAFVLTVFGADIYSQNVITTMREAVYEGYRQNEIQDLVLMYQGGIQRPECTVDFIYPYVVHTDRLKRKDWFFDGFLFLEFNDGQGYHFEFSWDPNGKIADKKRWEWLANRHFGNKTGINALEEAVKKAVEELGPAPFKHKVVIGLPEPVWNTKDWGELDDKKLDFSKREDRIKACKWYIDLVVKKFEDSHFKYIELAGIYWLNEQLLNTQHITIEIGNYIRKKGMRFYWIPYYTATGFSEWYEYGFDMAYLQPTHFFNRKVKDDRVDSACKLAFTHNMGVEVEFDSNALCSSSDNKSSRLKTYMESLDRNDAFRNASLAYYEGGDGIYRFSKSTQIEDKILMDTLHSYIKKRKKGKALLYENFTGLKKELNAEIWNISGNTSNFKTNDAGLTIGGKGTVNINTRNKLAFRYSRIELKVRVLPGSKYAKTRIRLLPVKELHGPWPNSGEILLMGLHAQNTYMNLGQNTEQNNELKRNMRGSVFYMDRCDADKTYTIVCEWKEDRIFTYIDGKLVHTNENLLEPNTNTYHKDYYTKLWPFGADFYLDINVESKTNKPAICIESIRIDK